MCLPSPPLTFWIKKAFRTHISICVLDRMVLRGSKLASATDLTWHKAIIASSHPGCRMIQILVPSRRSTTRVERTKKVQSSIVSMGPLFSGTWFQSCSGITLSCFASPSGVEVRSCRLDTLRVTNTAASDRLGRTRLEDMGSRRRP